MTPRALGWRLAPAWRPQARFWLVWPASATGGDAVEALREECLEFVSMLAEFSPVTLLASPEDVAEASLRTPTGVGTLSVAQDCIGLRASAPAFLVDGDGALVAGTDGGAPAARAILDSLGMPAVEAPGGFGAGSLDVDGEGSALAAEGLLNRLGRDRQDAERFLSDWLGIERVVWLEAPAGGAEVAVVARFLAPGLVVAVGEGGEAAANLDRLAAARDVKGRPFEVVDVPAPRRRRPYGLSLSYADCVVAGRLVVVPAYEDAFDGEAFDLYVAAVPDRLVVAQPALELARITGGLGAAVAVQPGV